VDRHIRVLFSLHSPRGIDLLARDEGGSEGYGDEGDGHENITFRVPEVS
jgi:hypothetical protein